jgi:hypothetical protein
MTTTALSSFLSTNELCFLSVDDPEGGPTAQIVCLTTEADTSNYPTGRIVLEGLGGSGNVNISNVRDPVNNQDAATKFYVDSTAG